MLYTASFYAPQDWVGKRYRVSRQHPRGRRTEWEVLPFLYPALELLRAYRSKEIDFAELSREYERGLDEGFSRPGEFRTWVEAVLDLGDFTLLCFEPAGQPCHRRVLGPWLVERVPGLELGQLR
jgi:uncharacterized protein YeaO (DUF488 family)